MIDFNAKRELFKRGIDGMAGLALDMNGTHTSYTDMELNDCIVILMEVALAKAFDYHGKRLAEEEMSSLAEEFGKNIRQSITLFTGVDPAKVFDNEDALKALKLK